MMEILKDKKCIFFDVGYTLDTPASGDWLFTNKFYELANEKLKHSSLEIINQARKIAISYIEKNHLVFTLQDEENCFKNFYSIISNELELGFSNREIDEISKDRTRNMDNYIIYPNVVETLKELKKTFKLGVISDTWPSIENQLKHIGIYDFFDTYTYSCFLGVFKPNELMYKDALNKMNINPKDCIFIDDSITNLDGAAKLGITPILIAANPKSDIDTVYTKIYSIADLLK